MRADRLRAMPPGPSRRRILTGGLALGVAAPFIGPSWGQAPRFAADPFALGVASGYPLPGGVVLWTRLAPAPLVPGGGMPGEIVAVEWEVAADEKFATILRQGTTHATPDWAHTLHVEVDRLAPDRWYFYRFRVGPHASPVGRTRTAPANDALPERLKFAVASCQHYEQGYFAAYRHVVADAPDLVAFVGDYIYESSWGRDPVRAHGAPEPYSLEDYRIRYALYRTDPDLQAAHAACPWIVTWDDHEVDNDYGNDRSEEADEPALFLARRAAAYKAYYEHMPLRRRMLPFGPHMRLYARQSFGRLAEFHLIDDRQYRDPLACPRPGRGGSNILAPERCPELADPRRSLLGLAQERWLHAGLDGSRAAWNILAQQTLFSRRNFTPGQPLSVWTDGWDGYPAARRRLTDFLASRKPRNPVFVGGDVHAHFVAAVKAEFDDPRSAAVASEFCGTSISSQNPRSPEHFEAVRRESPWLAYASGAKRGYLRVELAPKRLTVDLRGMANVTARDAGCDTLASFAVEDGAPVPHAV
jgi:alkaline phosphatase D